ncbi:glucuronokinase 1 isoform X2 [Spinacia oleracea]|uniref:glucuronokinase n=1 Tax=Spinacia oleracea TaxID=3562 RepID=A0A9R0IV22_SPIOL|nr:glucuronokinase 1-like isoform X2 [Spinacia oleracea]
MTDVIQHKAYARIGLLGNPSDVYYGNTISISITNFWASVKLEPSEHLIVKPHHFHDLVEFDSLNHLVNRLETEGFYGGVRLLMAICKIFYKYCKNNLIDLHERNFTLSYDTNIPRQTGLSGSSAIVCAALNCMLDFYKIRHLVRVEERPNLILDAEKELGIVAGLQDRVAQVYGGVVFMDFGKTHMEKLGHGIYSPMDISLLPPLYLIYAENPSDSGKVHSTVRKRWLDGDDFIRSTMKEVANLAVEGRQVLLQKDYAKLASLMNHNFDLRSMFGDDALGEMNLKMVEIAREVGAASKFTGSGGAVVAFCPAGPLQVELLQEACEKAGFIIQPVQVASSFLNDMDLGNSSST